MILIKIVLENFKYNTNSNIFKSIGLIEIKDKLNNEYKFSQIYIDTKKRNTWNRYKCFILKS